MVTINSIKNKINSADNLDGENTTCSDSSTAIAFAPQDIKTKLLNLNKPCYFVSQQSQIGVTNNDILEDSNNGHNSYSKILTAVPPLLPQQLGDNNFLESHNVKYAYMAGSMANGISSEELVIALSKAQILSSFGAGGLTPNRIEQAIDTIQTALNKNEPYAFNLIHSPSESAIERKAVELYLKYQVTTVEASAFSTLTPSLVYYRVSGLSLNSENQIQIKNKVIAKISRREVATKFMQPAPDKILKQLVSQGLITELQAKLASQVPMADDITAEADSGGHTDNRPLVSLLPSIIALRDEIQARYNYEIPMRVGAAGGIGTPQSALGAFMMGAAYLVTGSVNQSCIEAGASQHTKQLLAQADMADVMMAPAADMFEMGVKLQVLKRGTMFGMRAQKLYELYKNYNSIAEIPLVEKEKLETQIFRKSLAQVWQDTITYFQRRDPQQIERAINNPKRKMALIFRSYLGLSSRWSNVGEPGREIDYQIWCGATMGAFNEWVTGSYLAEPNNRSVIDVAHHIMTGSAYLYRLQNLKIQGISLLAEHWNYQPQVIESINGT